MKVNVIIAAAGYGKRFGGKTSKQLLLLEGKPILYYSLKVFEEIKSVSNICIVTNDVILDKIKEIVTKYKFKKVKNIILGGEERQQSIYEGLKTINNKSDSIVLIHDSVRPFIDKSLVNSVIKSAGLYGSGIPSIPLKDTIKFSKDGSIFENTPDRKNLWAVQTPQGFKYSIIMKAHKKAVIDSFYGTDDASLLEHIGHKTKMVKGYEKNMKITTPIDLSFARLLIKNND
jgi:2-C-methyl-D-erythritol 4-phosphate cytidylyltransferase